MSLLSFSPNWLPWWQDGVLIFLILTFCGTAWHMVKVKVKVAQLCPAICDPMDYTIHGILQARILKWVAFPFSRRPLPNPEIEPKSPTLQAAFWPAELQGKLQNTGMGSLSLFQWIFPTQELNWVSCIAGRFFTNWAMREAPYGRKWRTKEPLDEGERGDGKMLA